MAGANPVTIQDPHNPAMAVTCTPSGALLSALADGATGAQFSEATAVKLGAMTAMCSQLVAPPGEWAINSAPAAGTQASVTRAAGGAGVRHVAKAVAITLASTGLLPTVATFTVSLRDGPSGGGAILMTWVIRVDAAINKNYAPITMCGLNVVGSADTAMTIEFNAGAANLLQAVSLTGYDGV